jgi:hypothetical protein
VTLPSSPPLQPPPRYVPPSSPFPPQCNAPVLYLPPKIEAKNMLGSVAVHWLSLCIHALHMNMLLSVCRSDCSARCETNQHAAYLNGESKQCINTVISSPSCNRPHLFPTLSHHQRHHAAAAKACAQPRWRRDRPTSYLYKVELDAEHMF